MTTHTYTIDNVSGLIRTKAGRPLKPLPKWIYTKINLPITRIKRERRGNMTAVTIEFTTTFPVFS